MTKRDLEVALKVVIVGDKDVLLKNAIIAFVIYLREGYIRL